MKKITINFLFILGLLLFSLTACEKMEELENVSIKKSKTEHNNAATSRGGCEDEIKQIIKELSIELQDINSSIAARKAFCMQPVQFGNLANFPSRPGGYLNSFVRPRLLPNGADNSDCSEVNWPKPCRNIESTETISVSLPYDDSDLFQASPDEIISIEDQIAIIDATFAAALEQFDCGEGNGTVLGLDFTIDFAFCADNWTLFANAKVACCAKQSPQVFEGGF